MLVTRPLVTSDSGTCIRKFTGDTETVSLACLEHHIFLRELRSHDWKTAKISNIPTLICRVILLLKWRYNSDTGSKYCGPPGPSRSVLVESVFAKAQLGQLPGKQRAYGWAPKREWERKTRGTCPVFDFSAGPSARGRQLYGRACNFKNVSALLV